MEGGSTADDTVRLKIAGRVGVAAPPPPPPAPPTRISWPLVGGAVALFAAGLAAGLLFWPAHQPPPVPERPAAAAVAALPPPPVPELAPATPAVVEMPAPAPGPPLASEADLDALLPAEPTMLRLQANPAVFVLLFPTLDIQGAALNRLAALVEKAGLPRDRLLGDDDLARAIRQSGDTPATWYLGHDYAGADIARFQALADRDGVPLNANERWVLDRYREARGLVPEGSEVALISTANPDQRMDAAMRATILHHEIGHGQFFTRPEFHAHVLQVWRERLTEPERKAFRAFLRREGYEPTNETLMANETMAYLLFTPDARFFAPHHVGMSEEEVERLRGLFRDGMPVGMPALP